MSATRPENTGPTISVTVTLGPALARRLADSSPAGAVGQALAACAGELLGALGIPGHPAVSLVDHQRPLPDDRPVEIRVGERLCLVADEAALQAHSYVSSRPLAPYAPDDVAAWLEHADDDVVAEWLALVLRGALARQPGALLGAAQAAAYIAGLPPSSAENPRPAAPDALADVLRQVLDLGISLADRARVRAVLDAAGDSRPALLAEQLITALRPDVIEIHVEPGYLREITTHSGARFLRELLPFMNDGLFVELGLTFPTFRFIPDDQLKPQAFALTINHLAGQPWVGLPPEHILVNDTVERLRLMNIEGEAAGNPATFSPSAIVDAGHKALLEASGLTTWDHLGYIILVFAAELRRNGARVVSQRLADQHVSQLGKAFPAIERAVKEHIAPELLAGVLRALAGDEVSVRNLRCILERLLEYELFVGAGDRVGFVRAGLRDQIGHKLARGTQTLVVYLLDAAIEQALVTPAADGAGDEQRRQIVSAIRAEMAYLPPTAQLPVILTTPGAREPLRLLLAAALPRLRAVSYSDIAPDLNIQPVARISLG